MTSPNKLTNWTLEDCQTFGEAVLSKIQSMKGSVSDWKLQQMQTMWLSSQPNTLSIKDARRVADVIFGEKDSVSL